MVSKIANRNKLVGSRRKIILGGTPEAPETPKAPSASLKRLIDAKAAHDEQNIANSTNLEFSTDKKSDQLRIAAYEALTTLRNSEKTKPYVTNIKEEGEKTDEVFYQRWQSDAKSDRRHGKGSQVGWC